jgi:hypothetical protein
MNPASTSRQHYPRVQQAMQAEVVRDLLNRQLDGRGLRFEELAVDYSFYVPDHNFRIVYRGRIANGSSRASQLLFGRIPVGDDHAERFGKVQRKLQKGRYVQPELGDAAYHLPEIGMVLWTFPNDPRLKTLPRLLRAETLRAVFRAFPHRRNWELGAHGYDMARYIPSKRCVLRFHIEWRGPRPQGPLDATPTPASELETVYGKVYESPESVQQAWATLNDLWLASRKRPGFLRIPQPLHVDVDLQTVWMARVPGSSLTLSASQVRPETCAAIGAGLGQLQQSPIRVPGRHPLETELRSLDENVAAVAAVHPDQDQALQEIVGRLRAHLPSLPRLPLVPSHGTFKLNHILGDEEGTLSLLDFDSMTAADPLFDVANFTSDLFYLEAQGMLTTGRAVALSGALQQAYFATVPWGRRQQVLDWLVASLLLRKQAYKTVKHLHGDAEGKIGSVMQEALSRTRRLDS